MNYDIFREELAVKHPAYGHGLWEPSPRGQYTAVEIGDVGFIREGYFHRLFNVQLPEDHPSHQDGVPRRHEPLVLRTRSPTSIGTLQPNDLRSNGVSDRSDGSGRWASGPDEAEQHSFSCSRRRGAVLSLPVPAQCKDTSARGDFAKCITKHINEWFAFARERGLGISREDIILVTGCHLARTWATIAFQEKEEQVSFGVQTYGVSNATWQFTRKGAKGVAYNLGPSGQNLPENQCIFVRGFRVTLFSKILPILRGAAGPDQLPDEGDPDPDPQLNSVSTETHEPLHTLMEYIATQAPDCDMALVHDDDLRYIGNASLESLRPDIMMNYLRKSAPKIWQVQCDWSSTSHGDEGASKAGAPPPKAVAKVASLSKLAFGAPEDYLALDAAPTDERHSMTFLPSFQLSLQPVGTSDQHRREDLEEFDRFANARLEDLAGDILNLCKDRQLDDIYLKIDALQQYIKFLATPPTPVVTDDPNLWTRGDSSSKSTVHPVSKPVDSQHEGPDEPLIATDKNPYSLYGLPALSEPVKPSTIALNPPSRVTPTFPGAYFGGDVTLEGMDNIVRVSDLGTDPAKAPLVIKNVRSSSTTATSGSDHGAGVILEGMDDIVWVSDRTAGSSAERSVAMSKPASHALPVLREIKQQIERFTEGRFERTSHLDLSEPHNRVQLRRCAVRLLMSSASLSPADFASPIGFLGPSESTPYFPTGDLQRDRTVAFNTAMDCLDDMEDDFCGHDDVTIANTLCKLAQALSDLGLNKYALNTSGFALETLEHSYVAAPNDFRHHVASILSVQTNILYDLKQNDKAADAAHRAVTLFREHQDSQSVPVPELTFALLNYTVLLSSTGLKDESAAVAFELLVEVDESQPDMKGISALCNLCLSNMRFDAEYGMDLAATEETIELTRTSSSSISKTALAGALLNKSKILSSRGQNEAAIPFSAEAVTLLRDMSATRPTFSLFLAHALDTHAHHLLEADRKGESYSIRHDAVELWQTLKASAPDPIARPLAWSLFELAKFRRQGSDSGGKTLHENLRIAECAVEAFRGVAPPDVLGLADALYLLADRMLELDNNREAAGYAEESVYYFREVSAEDQKYALDLINSLSLASSCLAYTERDEDAFEYAKQAVEVQHMRKGVEDKHYDAHLRWLLMNVVFRSKEMNKEHEALPWLQELQALDPSVGNPVLRRGSMSQENGIRFKKQTSHWLDPNTDASKPNNSFTSSAPVMAAVNASTPKVDKGKGKEVAPSPEARGSTVPPHKMSKAKRRK